MQKNPNSTSDEIISAKFDSLGNMISDTINFKALNYNIFIPFLIKSAQELNEQNNSLQNKIDSLETIITTYESRFQQLEDMIATCCSTSKSGSITGETDINSSVEINIDKTIENNTVLHQYSPNPFKYRTTFNYSLGVDGFIELEIHDQYGNFITKLVSENQTTGNYSVNWEANDIAAGIYFYSLKVNGITWVNKAIKIK